ncbi:MAG: alpha/beta hydrolase [Candidatus Uhrbacteria bacterium]
MSNIFIIHGTGSNPENNWFPWLKTELEKSGHQVLIPKFPTPKNQSLQTWLETFENYQQYLNEETIVVGHSLGVAFLLSILENLKQPIKAAFFVSGFIGPLNNPEFDTLNQTFVTKTFAWEKIKKSCPKFFIINSDNDPYICLEKGAELAKNLDSELIILKNAGHINKESGHTKFEFLLKKIKEIV